MNAIPSSFDSTMNEAPTASRLISPGSWLGVLGGGQLGRMFAQAAQRLGYRVAVLDPDAASPAGAVAERHILAGFNDAQALRQFAEQCAGFTTEFENVPADALAWLARERAVAPAAAAVAVVQDRITEKRFVADCGLQVAPHAVIRDSADLAALSASLLPGILKVSRLGYDGKGQARVQSVDEARAAFAAFGGAPCVLEQMLPLAFELSVVCVRGFNGACAAYPVSENTHRDGILSVSLIPSPSASAEQRAAACAQAEAIATRLDYVGVLCVEFFVLQDGRLIVNEIAPRPHNSGHYTLNACVTDQFEQQVRALAGLPLGATTQHSAAVMINLLGDIWFRDRARPTTPQAPDWSMVLAHAGASLHLYGKAEPRPGRKMGHITCVAADLDDARKIARQIATALGLPLDGL